MLWKQNTAFVTVLEVRQALEGKRWTISEHNKHSNKRHPRDRRVCDHVHSTDLSRHLVVSACLVFALATTKSRHSGHSALEHLHSSAFI